MARLALLLLLAVAAGCPAEGGDDDYPIGGGGGGGGTSGPRTDAGTSDGGDGGGTGGGTINGRVCLLSDLRRLINAAPGDCATSGAGGISVSLGNSAPVTTQADGRFSIPAQEGTNLAWRVSALNLMPSIVPLSGSSLLPAIRDDAYNDLVLQNGGVPAPGNGAIVARVIRTGAPVMGATAALVGGQQVEQTRYDGTNPTVWGTTATGAFGVAWLPDNVAGPVTLRVTQGPTVVPVSLTIAADAITFVTIALP